MKTLRRRSIVILVLTSLLISLINPSVFAQGNTQVLPTISVENIPRNIIFTKQDGLWVINERGENLRKLSKLSGYDYSYWGRDGEKIVVNTFDQGVKAFYEDGAAASIEEKDVQAFYYQGQSVYSPKKNYMAVTFEYSTPFPTPGIPDTFIYRLNLTKITGELIATLSDRSLGIMTWSEDERYIAFFERDERTREEVLVVYALRENTFLRVNPSMSFNPIFFVLNGHYLLYFPDRNQPGLLNLDTGETRILDQVEYFYPGESLGSVTKIAEAGSKLVFANVTFGYDFGKFKEGIYVCDLETGEVKPIVYAPVFGLDVAADKIAYVAQDNHLYIVGLNGGAPTELGSGGVVGGVGIQPRIPVQKYSKRRVLVLAQGIGTQIGQRTTPADIFPELWPIFREALDRGIYQDVILFSYNGGRMESGKWVPGTGNPDASFQSISQSVAVMANMLNKYASAYPGVTFDLLGHSLGGKVEWEYLKSFLNAKTPIFKIGRIVTLSSPINGLYDDAELRTVTNAYKSVLGLSGREVPGFLDMLDTPAFQDLVSESRTEAGQKLTDLDNFLMYQKAAKEGIQVYTLASDFDCIVRFSSLYPHRDGAITEVGFLYHDLGRGLPKVPVTSCSLVELAYNQEIGKVIDVINNGGDVNSLFGHDRTFTSLVVELDLKDMLIYNRDPGHASRSN